MTANARSMGRGDDGKVLTIIEHLQELRYRVMVSASALVAGVLVSVWFGTGRGAWVVITGAESTSDLDRARRTEEFPFPS